MRKMKASNNEIIGLIPSDWEKKRLKYLCTIQTGNEDTQNADPDGEYPFYVRSPIIERCVRYTFEGEGILVAGDGAGAGRIFHHVNGKYAVHQRVYRLAHFKFNPSFIHYYLSNIFPMEMDKGSAQSTVPSMRLPMLLNFPFFLPSPSEADIIVNILDSKCAEIDALFNDIQSEIDILEEYKRSVITETVTKGLDKTVPMKDSGEEWIGRIPINWNISKLGNVMHLRNERNYKPLEEVNLISLYTDKGVVQHSDLEKTSGNIAQNADGYKIVHKDDIVVNIILAWMGAMGISNYYGVTSPAYDVYAIDKKVIVPHYCHYLLRTPAIAGECYKYGRGIMLMRWRTYSTEFKRIKMPLPPIEEQQAIADYLDDKVSKIDSIIASKKEQLEIISQYKKSVIYEYITGKKIPSVL